MTTQVHHQAGAAVAPFVFVSAMGLEHALSDWRELMFTEVHVQEATPGSYVVNAVKEYPDGRLMWLLEIMRVCASLWHLMAPEYDA